MRDGVQQQVREVVSTCLAYRTRKLARTVTRLYNRHLRPLGMTVTEMNLMVAIAAQRSVQPARLGRAMGLEKSTLSRNVGRLVDRGWVETSEPADGRGVLLTLTARGEEMLRRSLPAWKEAQERARSLVSEALTSLPERPPK